MLCVYLEQKNGFKTSVDHVYIYIYIYTDISNPREKSRTMHLSRKSIMSGTPNHKEKIILLHAWSRQKTANIDNWDDKRWNNQQLWRPLVQVSDTVAVMWRQQAGITAVRFDVCWKRIPNSNESKPWAAAAGGVVESRLARK